MLDFFIYVQYMDLGDGIYIPKLEKYLEYLESSDISSNSNLNELVKIERLGNDESSIRNSGIYQLTYTMVNIGSESSELNIKLILDGYYSKRLFEVDYIDVNEYEISKPEKYQQVSMMELIKNGKLYEHRIIFSNGEKFFVKCRDIKFREND